jgi:hypothetical protein
VATAEDISHWRARGAGSDAEATAAQEMVELMGAISEGAFEASWCVGLPDLLRSPVQQLIAGRDPDFEPRNPLAFGADAIPAALRRLAEVACEHRIWLRETDASSDFLRVVPDAFAPDRG